MGLQTSRGCAEFGRREREVTRRAPTLAFWLGYLKHDTAEREAFLVKSELDIYRRIVRQELFLPFMFYGIFLKVDFGTSLCYNLWVK